MSTILKLKDKFSVNFSIKIIFYSILIILLLFIFYNAFVIIYYPFGIEYGEGVIAYQVNDLIFQKFDLKAIYPDIHQIPYNINPYTPLYHLSVAVTTFIFDTPPFLAGRLISLIAFLGLVIIIFKISNIFFSNDRKIALIITLLFLSFIDIFAWSLLSRVDILAFVFCVGGIYIFLRYLANSNKRSLVYLSAILFILAFYSRQTYLIAPISVLIYLFLSKNKDFLRFFISFSVISALVFLYLNLITGWNFFYHAFYQNSLHHFSYERSIAGLFGFVATRINIFLFFIISLNFTLYLFFRKELGNNKNRTTKKVISFLFIYSLFGYYFFLMTFGKAGSTFNYFFELMLINILLFIASIKLLEWENPNQEKFATLSTLRTYKTLLIKKFLPVICLLLLFVFHYSFINKMMKGLYYSLSGNFFLQQKINSSKYYYADFTEFLTHTEAIPITTDPFIYTELYNHGIFELADIRRLVTEEKLSLVAISSPIESFRHNPYAAHQARLSDDLIILIKEYYELEDIINDKFIYTLKNKILK